MSEMWLVSYLLLWALVGILAMAVVMLCRQVGLIHSRLGPAGARMTAQGPEIGARPDRLKVEDIDGRTVVVGGGGTKNSLLVFLSPNCDVCKEIGPAIRMIWRREHDQIDVICISLKEDETFARQFIAKAKIRGIPFIISSLLRQEYKIEGGPYGVLLDKSGIVVAKGIINNTDHVESLLNAGDLGFASIESFAKANRQVAGAVAASRVELHTGGGSSGERW